MTTKRLIVAITGASGAIYGIRLLQVLRTLPGWETHLVMSASGALTASQEVDLKRSEIEALADEVHSVKDIGAAVSSGSFRTAGMVVAHFGRIPAPGEYFDYENWRIEVVDLDGARIDKLLIQQLPDRADNDD